MSILKFGLNVVLCKIDFVGKPDKCYECGETIKASVMLRLRNGTSLTGFQVHIYGKASCKWQRGIQDGKTRYRGFEDVLDEHITLMGSTEDHPPHYFGPGDHYFAFEYQLPDKLPISTPGAVGRIEYSVTVRIRGDNWNLLDIVTVTEPFEVRRPPAINTAVTKPRSLKKSEESESICTIIDDSSIEQEQRIYFFLWNMNLLRRLRNIDVNEAAYSLPLIITAKVGGEILATDAGKMIEVTIEVDNQSPVRVQSFVVQLIQFIRYTASRPFKGVKEVYHLVTENRLKGVSGGRKQKYQSLLKLPDNGLTPNEDIETESVQLHYEIQVRAKTNFLHEDDKVTVPIAIARMPK